MFRPAIPALTRQRIAQCRIPSKRWSSFPRSAQSTSRIERLESRVPHFLRRYTTPLRTAPVSHITAFLILHEITAVVPLLGFGALFYYTNWLPPHISEGKWVSEGTEKFGRYLRKKGWIKDNESKESWSGPGEDGVRIVTSLATAYAITKALIPLRIMLSVWASPWFARVTVLPVKNAGSWAWRKTRGRFERRSVGAVARLSPATGTNAVGGRALPRTDAKPDK